MIYHEAEYETFSNDHFEVVELLATHYGIEFDVIYCNVTGKPLGRLFPEESEMLLQMSTGTPAEIAADLSYRCLMSMKSSIHWILGNEETLKERRVSMPREVMAWAINRLFAPVKGQEFHFHTQQLNKIHLFALLSEVAIDDDFNSVMAMLLELEARIGLLNIKSSFTQEDLGSQEGNFMSSFIKRLRPFHVREINALREREANAKFGQRLNRGANTAFMDQMLASAKIKVKPKVDSELARKRDANKALRNNLASMLDDLMSDEADTNADVVVEPALPKAPAKPNFSWAKKFVESKAAE